MQIFSLPKSAVDKQKCTETAEGKRLNFILNSEKYAACLKQLYSYEGEPCYTFSPAPSFTFIIDNEGFIKSADIEINRRSTSAQIPHHNMKFSVKYKSINALSSLDFSALDESKYKSSGEQ